MPHATETNGSGKRLTWALALGAPAILLSVTGWWATMTSAEVARQGVSITDAASRLAVLEAQGRTVERRLDAIEAKVDRVLDRLSTAPR